MQIALIPALAAALVARAHATLAFGAIQTIAGNGGSVVSPGESGVPATSTPLGGPSGVAVDQHDNVYIADVSTNRVRKVVNSTGILRTIAGGGLLRTFEFLNDVAVNDVGNLFISEYARVWLYNGSSLIAIVGTGA